MRREEKDIVTGEIKYISICDNCGKIIEGDDICIDDKIYCEDCVRECDVCGKYELDSELENVRYDDVEQYVCRDCIHDASVCKDCGDYYSSTDNMCYVHDYGYVCPSCAEYNYYRCEECGEWFTVDDFNTEENLCDDCNEILNGDYDSIHEYGYKPVPMFYGDSISPVSKTKYFGMELEFATARSSCKEFLDIVNKDSTHCYLKNDSSIQPGGYEIVTHPHTHTAMVKWIDNYLSKGIDMLKNKYSIETYGCGCHFHVSKSAIGVLTFGNIVFLLGENKYKGKEREFFLELCNRESDSWCEIGTIDPDDIECLCFKKKIVEGLCNHGVAINTANENTLEFRLFNSTSSTEEIKMYIDVVESIIVYCSNKKFGDVSIKGYIEYIKDNSKIYKRVHNKIKTIDIDTNSFTHKESIMPKEFIDGVPTKKYFKNIFNCEIDYHRAELLSSIIRMYDTFNSNEILYIYNSILENKLECLRKILTIKHLDREDEVCV